MPRKKASAKASVARRPLGRTYIAAWRRYRGFTNQAELADRLDDAGLRITAATISRIETGKTPYSQVHLEALAQVLQCSVADLLVRDPKESENEDNGGGSIRDILRSSFLGMELGPVIAEELSLAVTEAIRQPPSEQVPLDSAAQLKLKAEFAARPFAPKVRSLFAQRRSS